MRGLWLATTMIAAASVCSSAFAAGEIIITQQKALAGNVTPGDAPGFPVELKQSGVYQLGSDLYPPAGKNGIQVFNYNITIDFDGFSLRGNGQALFGIAGGADNVTIENGSIQRFKSGGIGTGDGKYWIVRDMRITQNGGAAVACGPGCLVENSIFAENSNQPVAMDSGSILNSIIIGAGAGAPFLVGSGTLGYGNNTIFGFDPFPGGAQYIQMDPNARNPACPN